MGTDLPYISGTPCSQCPTGYTQCVNNLCAKPGQSTTVPTDSSSPDNSPGGGGLSPGGQAGMALQSLFPSLSPLMVFLLLLLLLLSRRGHCCYRCGGSRGWSGLLFLRLQAQALHRRRQEDRGPSGCLHELEPPGHPRASSSGALHPSKPENTCSPSAAARLCCPPGPTSLTGQASFRGPCQEGGASPRPGPLQEGTPPRVD